MYKYNNQAREKFYSSFKEVEGGCWIWKTGTKKTYPAFYWDKQAEDAHRASYRMNKGDIPKGKIIMHSCDNMRCVNPNHLTLATHSTNLRDAYSKGRASKKGERHHFAKFTEKDILKIRSLATKMKQSEIAQLFNTRQQNISRIVNRKRWTHI
jgi:hypothetical protein